MHDVLQIAPLKVFRCAVGVHFVFNCVGPITLPDLGVLKIALLKTISGVCWYALARLKRHRPAC